MQVKKNLFYTIIATIFLVGCNSNSETVNGSINGGDNGSAPAIVEMVEVDPSAAALERVEMSEGMGALKTDDTAPSIPLKIN